MLKPIRVLYFTSFDLSLAKGPSINEREFVGQLFRQRDIEIRAIVPGSANGLDDLSRKGMHFINYAWGRSFRSIVCSEREIERAIGFELNTFKPDIVVGRLALLPFGCIRALRHYSVPFAIKSLGSAGFAPNGWGINQIVTRVLQPAIRSILRKTVQRAQIIDTTTSKLRNLIVKQTLANPDQVYIVPNSTNTQRFAPHDSSYLRASLGIPKEGIVIGYTGGDPLQRGGLEVIYAVKRLREEGVDAYGVIVGGAQNELVRQARQLNISEQIHVPGRAEYESMPNWINLIDIGIALDNIKRSNVTGNSYQKVRQFVSCGKFIITLTDDTDIIAKCPLVSVIQGKESEDIYLSILGILNLSQSERIARQEKGRAFAVEQLSLEKAVKTRLDLWRTYLED